MGTSSKKGQTDTNENNTIIGFLKTNLKENRVIKVEMDYTNTTWESKESYKTFCGESYDERVILSRTTFIDTFNKTNSDIVLSDTNGNNLYHIVLQVNNLARRVGVMRGGPPQIKVQIEGIIKVMDVESNNVVRYMNFNLMGEASQTPSKRLSSSFEELAHRFARS